MTVEDTIVKRRSSGAAKLALLLSVIAIIFSIVAFNRTGQNLQDLVAEQVENATQTGQRATDSLEQGIDAGPDGVDDGSR